MKYFRVENKTASYSTTFPILYCGFVCFVFLSMFRASTKFLADYEVKTIFRPILSVCVYGAHVSTTSSSCSRKLHQYYTFWFTTIKKTCWSHSINRNTVSYQLDTNPRQKQKSQLPSCLSYCKFCIYAYPVNSKFTLWQLFLQSTSP